MGQTLDSIIAQSYQNWEAIIIDDGSSDNSIEVGKAYAEKEKNIKFIQRNTKKCGAPVCRNLGIEHSTGDYLIFLDSDDLLADFCLKQRADTINEHPELDFLVFPMYMFTHDTINCTHVWNVENEKSDYARFLSLDAVWQTTGPIWKKEAAIKIGGFTEGLACWQDVDIHLKALENGLLYRKFYNMQPDSYYRKHESGSISQGEISSLPKLRSRFEILSMHSYKNVHRTDETNAGFKIMAANISLGSARTLYRNITNMILDYSLKNNMIDRQFFRMAKRIQLLVWLRLNRIKTINDHILKLIAPYRADSNIGKHKYKTG